MSTSANTTDAQFKKTTQTIGANGNDVTATDKTLNDSILKDRAPGTADNEAEATDHNPKIERDLQEKGYSNRASDEQLDEAVELSEKLSKRGNLPQ
ncbi:unnamed protein product [Parajaminaea phylloscopi]